MHWANPVARAPGKRLPRTSGHRRVTAFGIRRAPTSARITGRNNGTPRIRGRARIAAVTRARALRRLCLQLCLILVSSSLLPAQPRTRLSPESDRAFDDYTKSVEAKLDWQAHIRLDQPGVNMVPGGAKPTVGLPDAIIHD